MTRLKFKFDTKTNKYVWTVVDTKRLGVMQFETNKGRILLSNYPTGQFVDLKPLAQYIEFKDVSYFRRIRGTLTPQIISCSPEIGEQDMKIPIPDINTDLVMTTGSHTITGTKTFSSNALGSESSAQYPPLITVLWANVNSIVINKNSLGFENGIQMLNVYNPVRKDWMSCPKSEHAMFLDDILEAIEHDIVEYVSTHAPDLNQCMAVYQEDRVSVEETFADIEKGVQPLG